MEMEASLPIVVAHSYKNVDRALAEIVRQDNLAAFSMVQILKGQLLKYEELYIGEISDGYESLIIANQKAIQEQFQNESKEKLNEQSV